MTSPTPQSPTGVRAGFRRWPWVVTRALRLVFVAAKAELVLFVLAQVIAGLALAGQLVAGRRLLQDLAAERISRVGDAAGVIAVLLAMTAVAGLIAVVVQERQRLMHELVERHAVAAILRAATSVELAAFDDPTFHDRLRRALAAAAERPWQLVSGLVSLGSATVGLAAVSVVVAALEPALLLILAAAVVPLALLSLRTSRAVYHFALDQTADERRRTSIERALTEATMAAEVRSFAMAQPLADRHRRIVDTRITGLRALVVTRTGAGAATLAVATLVTGVCVVYLVHRAAEGASLATVTVAAVALQQLGSRLRLAGNGLANVLECTHFLDDYLSVVADTTETADTASVPAAVDGVGLRNVSFAYPGTTGDALAGVTIDVRRGELVALVGASGSGKSTVARLLAGLYNPAAGELVVNGEPLAPSAVQAWRANVSVVYQDFARFELSAADNISAAHPHPDPDRIRAAARAAGADAFLAALPDGYDTVLSRAFEAGAELSTGEWQRVAVARALFRDGAVVILDEPTSSLDPLAEDAIRSLLRQLAATRAVIVASHRVATVGDADRIYVLAGGRVVEQGTHDDLLGAGGAYARLFADQRDEIERDGISET